MTGTIKTLISDKGFGFISREGETKDLFFHRMELKGVEFDQLQVGDKVTFEVNENKDDPRGKGPFAAGVSRE